MTYTKIVFIISLVSLTVSFFHAQSAAAQNSSNSGNAADRYYFEETFFPVVVSKNTAVSEAGGSVDKSIAKDSGFGYDARTTLGYVWSNILFGLTYNMYSVDTSRGATADYEGKKTKTAKQEFGPTVGYFLGSWRFALTYFISATKNYSQTFTDASGSVTTDETYKNTAGSGFQLAIGYEFAIGGGFGISPTLIYRSVSYSKQSMGKSAGANAPYSTASLKTKAIDDELKPMITVSFSF